MIKYPFLPICIVLIVYAISNYTRQIKIVFSLHTEKKFTLIQIQRNTENFTISVKTVNRQRHVTMQ
jgi:hypothetical protein